MQSRSDVFFYLSPLPLVYLKYDNLFKLKNKKIPMKQTLRLDFFIKHS